MLKPHEAHPAAGARRLRMEKVNVTPAHKTLPHPAGSGPRIFADSANITEIKPLKEGGIIHGVTTNPTLLKRAGANSWQDAVQKMGDICQFMHPFPVSLELTALDPEAMLQQAHELASLNDNVVIKVPVGGYGALGKNPFTGLQVIRRLWERDIKVNATLIFNTTQAFWAANAGASYVSPFLGRLADHLYKYDHPERERGNALHFIENHKVPAGGVERVANTHYVASGGARKDAGIRLIQEIMAVFNAYAIHTEVLAASLRHAAQVSECLLAGVDILTVPAPILMGVADHPLSDEGMRMFYEDAKAFA